MERTARNNRDEYEFHFNTEKGLCISNETVT